MINTKVEEELEYTAPTTVAVQPLTKASKSFLTSKRALPEAVVTAFKVASAADNRMLLPFYKTNGELVAIKYRHETGGNLKVIRYEKGAPKQVDSPDDFEPDGLEILFGTHLCDPAKHSTLHVFWDELDAMAGMAAGLPNCAGIPNTETDRFEFIRNQYEWLRKFKKIVIAPQILKDAANQKDLKKRVETLRRRLDAGRVFEVETASFGKCFSINGLLAKNGTEAVQRAVANSVHHDDPDFEYMLDGKSDKPTDGIATGWPLIDKASGGLHPGQYIVIAGNTGHGKTTTVLNLIARMLKADKTVFWHGVEGKNSDIRTAINRIVAGPAMLNKYIGDETGAEFYYAKDEAVKLIQEKYRKNLINLNDKKFQKATLETYFEKAQYAVDRYGVNVLVIDNLMGLTRLKRGESGYYGLQADVADLLTEFAEKNNVVVILLAHNKKISLRDGKAGYRSGEPKIEDVEGSGQITSWASLVLQIWKVNDVARHSRNDLTGVDGVISVVKGRNMGTEPFIKTTHCRLSRRQVELGSEHKLYDLMGWETPEIIRKIEEAAAADARLGCSSSSEKPSLMASAVRDYMATDGELGDDVMSAFS